MLIYKCDVCDQVFDPSADGGIVQGSGTFNIDGHPTLHLHIRVVGDDGDVVKKEACKTCTKDKII